MNLLKLKLGLTALIISAAIVIKAQNPFCSGSCFTTLESCYSCDITADLDGTSILDWQETSVNKTGLLCSNISPKNTIWYAFLAGEEEISIDLTTICPGTSTVTMGISQNCGEECLTFAGDCLTSTLNLSYDQLIPGEVYYLWINSCSGSLCELDIEVSNHDPYELDDLASISVYSQCREECLSSSCGEDSNCSDFSEIYVCSGERIELSALHLGNSSTDLGNYDEACSTYPPSLPAIFYWTVDNREYNIEQTKEKRSGPILTMPVVTETTVIEVNLEEVFFGCGNVEEEIWLDLVIEPGDIEGFNYQVCREELLNGWRFPIGEDDPLGDGDDWLGPEFIFLDDLNASNSNCLQFIEQEDCCNKIQEVCIEILNCNTDTTQLFIDYPWLNDLIDLSDCEGTSIETYIRGSYTYLFIKNENEFGVLYSDDGTKYCTDRVNFSCVEIYDLTGPTSTWECSSSESCDCPPDPEPVCGEDGNTYNNACEAACAGIDVVAEGECNTSSIDLIFEEYPWLTDIINPNDCLGATIETYVRGAYTYLFITREGEFGILYSDDGTKYCTDRSNFSCIEIYDLTGPTSIWECEEPPVDDQDLFERYPWLYSLIDLMDCAGTQVIEYLNGNYHWLFLIDSNGKSVLYNSEGLRYCTDRLNLDCRDTYGLTDNMIIDQFECHSLEEELHQRESKLQVKSIYPNPSQGLFNIQLSDKQPAYISVVNTNGKTIMNKATSGGHIKIDLSTQVEGVYYIIVDSKQNYTVNKVMLIR